MQMLNEALQKKWEPILEHGDLPEIDNRYKKNVVAQLLENTEIDAAGGLVAGQAPQLLGEAAPTTNTGGIQTFDPVLISLVRRSMPNLVSFDIMGTQPMSGPVGLVFAMRSRYDNQSGAEALFNEANTSHSATGSTTAGANTANYSGVVGGAAGSLQAGNDPTTGTYTYHTGMSTAEAEALGDSAGNAWSEMSFTIEKISVTAVSRALKSEYTMEMAQDLKAIHGLDAEAELSNILSAEVLAEINREAVRMVNSTATAGAQLNVASTGTFNLDTDSNGRWAVERWKGMIYQIDRDANAIARATRRGKGNILICSSDLAAALANAGMLDYTPALSSNLNSDDTGITFAGVLNGRYKVYIDPYFESASGSQYYTVGYRGSNPMDAGLFYCPYVPLQMVRAVGENNFQPKIGFKTRYGMVANPFATTAADGVVTPANKNIYYRIVNVTNIM